MTTKTWLTLSTELRVWFKHRRFFFFQVVKYKKKANALTVELLYESKTHSG